MPPNFSFVLPGRLAGMARPGTKAPLDEDLCFLRDQGIGAVVSLTPEPLDEGLVRAHGLDYLHVPVEDFTPPGPRQVDRFAAFADKELQAGRAVAVHCGMGFGRTGTMLACYLVHDGLDPDEAIWQVRLLRPRSIETLAQERAVHAYADYRARRGGQGP